MTASSLVQLIAACIGIIGSLFFAIGVMRQSIAEMAKLSGTYWDWNTNIPPALAAQKADYLFGGCLIVAAFATQLASFFFNNAIVLSPSVSSNAPLIAAIATLVLFFVLRAASRRVASHFEQQITAWLKAKQAQGE